MEHRQITSISPIPLTETRARFAKRLQESRRRGISPLVRTNSDPSLNKSGCSMSGENLSDGLSEQKENCSISSSRKSRSQVGSPRSTFFDSGYSTSRSKLIRIREDMILENSGNGMSRSNSTSCVEELKLSQLQGTSTPRTSEGYPNRTPNCGEEKKHVVTNPFDSALLESLHGRTFSPSVFQKVVSPTAQNDTPTRGFRWSIDHIAVLNPADIDEFPVHQSSIENQQDAVLEAKFQHAIDHFWSQQKVVAPSPVETASLRSRLLASQHHLGSPLVNSPLAGLKTKEAKTVETQTLITFPPELDLLKLLGNCFSYNEDTGSVGEESAANLSLNSLRRKLFAQPKVENAESICAIQEENHSNEAEGCLDTTETSILSFNEDRAESPVFFGGGTHSWDENSFSPVCGRRGSLADGNGHVRNLDSPQVSPIRNPEANSCTNSSDVSMMNSTEYFND